MISSLVNYIAATLIPLGSVGVFIASFFEEVIAPIPSALVAMTSGFLLLNSEPNSSAFFYELFLTIAIPAALGMVIGSLFLYGVCYAFGKPALERFGRYLGVSWEDVERVESKFSGTYADELTLLFLRCLPIIPNTAINIVCGLLRVPPIRYISISFAGMFIRVAILASIGAKVGVVYYHYAALIDQVENYIFSGFILVVLAVIGVFYLKRRSKIMDAKQSNETSSKGF